jgi:hypothetical protein
VESDGIGLSFLARHLVTLDFPGRTLYLKRVSVGPLPKPVTTAALDYLTTLKEQGKLPGWSKDDRGTPRALLSGARDIVTVKLSKNGAHDIYHFQVLMRPGAGPGRLQKAWRTTETGQMLEEYSIP